jgi:hypothetical protein
MTVKGSKEELEKFVMSASRYQPLQNAKGTQEAENLEFLQLDATGLQLQIQMWERFQSECEAQGGKDAPGAISKPVDEQSGISKAWQFKTGQERVLYLITRELQHVFGHVLELCCEVIKVDPNTVAFEFEDDFDVQAPTDEVTVATEFLALASGCATLRAEVLKRLTRKVYPDLPNMKEIEGEIEGAAERQANAPTPDEMKMQLAQTMAEAKQQNTAPPNQMSQKVSAAA